MSRKLGCGSEDAGVVFADDDAVSFWSNIVSTPGERGDNGDVASLLRVADVVLLFVLRIVWRNEG